MKFFKTLLAGLFLLPICAAYADATPVIDTGNTAWIIVATGLVMMMTPAGLALFYGGMSRYKNLLNTFAMTFISYCIASIVWVLWGYTLSFGHDINGFIGGFEKLFLLGVKTSDISGSIPELVFIMFQLTFACITVALVLGSIVDRMKFSSWIVFAVLWLTVVYSPICHWAWGGGWMSKMGALDFAGGNVVHINAGIAGLVLCIILGKRHGFGKEAMFPSSVTLTALGAALLWFGWFGFNAGSALAADGIAASSFLVTNTSAAIAALSWMCAEWYRTGKPTVLGIASGAVAGLVSITPAAGFVNLTGSLVIGLTAGILGYFSVSILKHKAGYDDSLDAFGVHGICGIWGAIATGLFACPEITPSAAGFFYGNPKQVIIQLISILGTATYSAVGTLLVIFVTKTLTRGIRVEKESEVQGLDKTIHGERAFEID